MRAPKEKQEENVFKLAAATAAKIGAPGVVKREDVVADTDYVGEGYGIPRDGHARGDPHVCASSKASFSTRSIPARARRA